MAQRAYARKQGKTLRGLRPLRSLREEDSECLRPPPSMQYAR